MHACDYYSKIAISLLALLLGICRIPMSSAETLRDVIVYHSSDQLFALPFGSDKPISLVSGMGWMITELTKIDENRLLAFAIGQMVLIDLTSKTMLKLGKGDAARAYLPKHDRLFYLCPLQRPNRAVACVGALRDGFKVVKQFDLEAEPGGLTAVVISEDKVILRTNLTDRPWLFDATTSSLSSLEHLKTCWPIAFRIRANQLICTDKRAKGPALVNFETGAIEEDITVMDSTKHSRPRSVLFISKLDQLLYTQLPLFSLSERRDLYAYDLKDRESTKLIKDMPPLRYGHFIWMDSITVPEGKTPQLKPVEK